MLKYLLKHLPLTLALILAILPGLSWGAPVTLTVHHFLGPNSTTQKDMIEPWARKIEKASRGQLIFKIFPSMTLGGKAPDLYQQVRDGVVDIVWTLPGYTPGVFPRSEVFELPFVHLNDARATNLAIQDIYASHLADDYRDVHPLLVHAHMGQTLLMPKKAIRRFEDLRGLKLRTPSRTGGWMIESWGAVAVGMPVPELPQSLSRGVVDGALLPLEVAIPLKLPPMIGYITEGEQNIRFGTAMFLYAMNKKRYESLDSSLREIINAHSGREFAEEIGRVWAEKEKAAHDVFVSKGTEFIIIDRQGMAPFRNATDEVVQRWVATVKKEEIDGVSILKAARKAIRNHSAP